MLKRMALRSGFVALILFFSFLPPPRPLKILVYYESNGWDHSSIPDGVKAVVDLCLRNNLMVDTTSNSNYFIEEKLKNYNAVVFLNTSGDVLDHRQQNEFERYIQAGGGFVGVHAASVTEEQWPWYVRMVGAYFEHHPSVQPATVRVIDRKHSSTKSLPRKWQRVDEWYNFKYLSKEINILACVDEKTYKGGRHGKSHPISWYHSYDGGRAFYTAMGHTSESYSEPLFLRHLLGGILYSAGENQELDYSRAHTLKTPEDSRFSRVDLDKNLFEPMALDIFDDGRIIYIERHGNIRLFNPVTETTRVINHIKVFDGNHDGLLGLALDPDFSKNHWVYLYYTPMEEPAVFRLSRFDFIADSLLPNSEKPILEIPTTHSRTSHSAGCLAFGPDRSLYIATGDNTIEDGSDGFAPADERKGREKWDAQRTSANSNSLLGKILRVHPEAKGNYTIPAGNLFPQDGSKGRPEIYIMGNRNPYRISVDHQTGYLYWGEVGPDAGKDSTGRGPKGYDEINQARRAGNFGWPYFIGPNLAYNYYDFHTQSSGAPFNAERPENHSLNNTGAQLLPPAQKALIWYPYSLSGQFPEVGSGGRNAMAGPVYRKDPSIASEHALPEYYNGKLFIYDWMRYWIMAVTLDEQGNFQKLEPFLPSFQFIKPIDIKISKDGVMYLLEYGSYWFSQNTDARLVKIEFWEKNRPPLAKASADKLLGASPLTVKFSSKGSNDQESPHKLLFKWKFSDENWEATGSTVNYTFTRKGTHKAVLEVTDAEGAKALTELEIVVGDNDAPEISFSLNKNKSFYRGGESLDYEVKVNDLQDKLVDPTQVEVTLKVVPQSGPGHSKIVGSNFLEGFNLIERNDCKSCHALDKRSVGPSYLDISRKYEPDLKTINNLVAKVIKGGSGNWGEVSMSPHPQLPEDAATQMIKYILSVEKEASVKTIPSKGRIFIPKPDNENASKMYVFAATYRDKGGEKSAPIEKKEQFLLRYPRLQAGDYDSSFEVSQKSGANSLLSFIRTGSYIMFKNIDLTDIKGVAMNVKHGDVGGKIDIRLDSIDGPSIGIIESKPISGQAWKWKGVEAPIKEKSGVHDLYFIYTFVSNHPPDSGALFQLKWIDFLFQPLPQKL